jgi:hypothetical protein
MADKRYAQRFSKRLKLRFGVEKPSWLAFSDEVSLNGMSIRTKHVLPPGSIVVIELYTPENTAVLLKGRVMWGQSAPAPPVQQAKKAGMGIRLLEILSGGETFYKLCSDRSIGSCNCPQETGLNA